MKRNMVNLPFDSRNDKRKCVCGHTTIQHSTQGHMRKGYWNCFESICVDMGIGVEYTLKRLCNTHKFKGS